MRKVHIVGRDFTMSSMYLRRGWEVVNYVDKDVSLIQFTGGEDVDPSYYQETRHPRTYSNPKRDAAEAAVFNEWVTKIPMAGVCRGAQFLNVMNCGKMWQHVNNHAVGKLHPAFCTVQDKEVWVTSTHHQMMIPAPKAEILMTANICTTRETASILVEGQGVDYEALLYPETLSLCYQPHPEYVGVDHECQETYFLYLDKFLLKGV